MRWLARILLSLGALFCLSAFLPADIGTLQLLWPFAPRTALGSGTPRLVYLMLAGCGAAGFGLALAGLVQHERPGRTWAFLVLGATATSTLLSLISKAGRAVLPLIVNTVLVWGLLRGHWTEAGGARPVLPDATRAVHPLLHVPVPWVFVLGYLAGLALQRLVGGPQPAPAFRSALWLAGLALIVLGAALAVWSLSLFHRARTTTVPLEAPSTVVTRGPYLLSRNPMYVSLTLIYLGECGIFAHLWPLLMLLPALLYVNGVVVPYRGGTAEGRLRRSLLRLLRDGAALAVTRGCDSSCDVSANRRPDCDKRCGPQQPSLDPRKTLRCVVVIELPQHVLGRCRPLVIPCSNFTSASPAKYLQSRAYLAAQSLSTSVVLSGGLARCRCRKRHDPGTDEERANLLGLLHHEVVDPGRGIDREVRVLVEPFADLVDIHFHAAEMSADNLQVRCSCNR